MKDIKTFCDRCGIGAGNESTQWILRQPCGEPLDLCYDCDEELGAWFKAEESNLLARSRKSV